MRLIKGFMKKTFWILLLFTYSINQKSLALATNKPPLKKILIVVQGTLSLKNFAIGDGRQLATLMGHFNTSTIVKGVQDYKFGELSNYDYTFYVGFEMHNDVPTKFLLDVYNTNKPVIWLRYWYGRVLPAIRYEKEIRFYGKRN